MTQVQFVDPSYLWLLAGLVPLALLWIWHCARRRIATRRYTAGRTVPVRERFATIGDLWVWLFAMIAMASTIVALARPQAVMNVARTAGADVVILLDASASMRVRDVQPDRWQRAVRWVRTFAETLSWRDDRVALGLFAHYAAPQLRLTKDPNALFFFLDHLSDEPPFRLDVDTTWDTNLEEGLYWGMRLLDKNEELYGPSAHARAFVVLTDGQAWSGDVRQSLALTTTRGIPTYIIGVGTLGGGTIPEPAWPRGIPPRWAEGGPVRAVLDRASLLSIAEAGRGRYFELGRESDLSIALRIIEDVRSRSTTGLEAERVDLYWRCLLVAASAAGLALMFTRERTQLWWQAAAVIAALLLVISATS
jgi:Ca-activated chloride channel family protein